MSIQRYDGDDYDIELEEKEDGIYVLYSDHVAALNEYRQQHDGISERYFQQIRNDALQEAREALELLPVSLGDTRFDPDDERCYVQAVRLTTALAAIDAMRGAE
jgi:hypothetical protein